MTVLLPLGRLPVRVRTAGILHFLRKSYILPVALYKEVPDSVYCP